jgi:hypothetical protein
MSEADSDSNGGSNGRDLAGRFTVGNPGGPGNPNLATLNRHRGVLLRSIRTEDLEYSLRVQVELMRDAKVSPSIRLAAAIAYQNRVLGMPATFTELEIKAEVDSVKQQLHLAGHPGFGAPVFAPRQIENGNG